MLRIDHKRIQLSLLPEPKLDAALSDRLSAINLDDLKIEGLGRDNWPMEVEQHLIRHHIGDLKGGNVGSNLLDRLGIIFQPMPPMAVLNRRPSELAGLFLWEEIGQRSLTVDTLLRANTLLEGSGEFRAGKPGYVSFTSGHRILFDRTLPAREFIDQWLAEFHRPVSRKRALERGIWLFLNFLIGHPFTDGNGRTARLLFQLYLHKSEIINAPIIPLGPYIFADQANFLSCSLEWELFYDVKYFYEFMIEAIFSTRQILLNDIFQNS